MRDSKQLAYNVLCRLWRYLEILSFAVISPCTTSPRLRAERYGSRGPVAGFPADFKSHWPGHRHGLCRKSLKSAARRICIPGNRHSQSDTDERDAASPPGGDDMDGESGS